MSHNRSASKANSSSPRRQPNIQRTPRSSGSGGNKRRLIHPNDSFDVATPSPAIARAHPSVDGQSLSSFVLPSSHHTPRSTSTSLPLLFPPFQRPFSSVQRGLYHQPHWPLHSTGRQSVDDDGASSFVPPHSELPYAPYSPFQFIALPVSDGSVALPSSVNDSSSSITEPPPLPSIRLPLRVRRSSSAAAAAAADRESRAGDVPSASSNALLVLTLQDGGVEWLVVVFATGSGSSSVALLTLPASVLSSEDRSALHSLSPADATAMSADLLRFASPLWQSAAADSPIVGIQCCDSPPLTSYSSLSSLPLVVAHSEQQATLYCITRRAASSASHSGPLLRLTALDVLRPFTSPLLCVSANHRLCSPTIAEIAAVDAGGCVYMWTVDATTRIEEQHSMQPTLDRDNEDDEEEVSSSIAESDAELDRRQVSHILRSSYDEPSHIATLPSLTFARCIFAPHPRSIVLALSDVVNVLNVRTCRTDSSADLRVDSRLLPVPVQSAVSVPVNRYRRAPERPQLIRDYFFSYQIYRAAQRTQLQQSVKAELGKDELAESFSNPVTSPASASRTEHVRNGELLDAVGVPGFPFVLAVLSSTYVQLIDIRHSAQPMMEWQHEQPFSSNKRPHLIPYTSDVGDEQRAGRHVLLLVFESTECAVLLYHCMLGAAFSSSAAHVTSHSTASPALLFANMRLPSFGDITTRSPSAFQLLPFTPQPLTGLCALVVPPASHGDGQQAHSLPPLTLLQLSRSGALIMQRWRAVADHNNMKGADEESGDGRADELSSLNQLPRVVLSSVSGLLFPSDQCAPAFTTSAVVRRHNVFDLSSAMHALLYGRHTVRSIGTHPAAPSVELVLDALERHVLHLQQWMLIPRSAREIAQYVTSKRWLQQEAEQVGGQLAHSVYRVLHGWMQRTQQQQQQQQGGQQQCGKALPPPPVPVYHFHAQHGHNLPSPPNQHALDAAVEVPLSLTRCNCNADYTATTTAPYTASQCCPPQCCSSWVCLLADSSMFHSAASLLPSLTFELADEKQSTALQADESERRAASQQPMDLSQDIGTLLQLIAQPQTSAHDAPSHGQYSDSGSSSSSSSSSKQQLASNARACDELLSSMSRQWQQWHERAVDKMSEQQQAAEQVHDLDVAWQGLQTAANNEASNAARDEGVDDIQSWQELADDVDDEED